MVKNQQQNIETDMFFILLNYFYTNIHDIRLNSNSGI
jgi:hypothetical protein